MDRHRGINLLLELPCLGGWQHAHTGMPHIDKRECMAALDKVHERGVLHGNLKLRHVLRCIDMRMMLVGFANARALVPMPQYGIEKATEADLVFEKRKLAYLLDYDNARANEEKRTSQAGLTHPRPWTLPVDRDAALAAPFKESELAAWRKEADATTKDTFFVPRGDVYSEAGGDEALKSFEHWLARRRQALHNNVKYFTDRAMPGTLRHASEVSRTNDVLYHILPEVIAPLPVPDATEDSGTGSSRTGPSPTNASNGTSSPQSELPTASGSRTSADAGKSKALAPSPVELFAYSPIVVNIEETHPAIVRLLATPDSTYNDAIRQMGAEAKAGVHRLDLDRAHKFGLRFPRTRIEGRLRSSQGLGKPMRAKLKFDYTTYRTKTMMIKAAYHKMLKNGKRLVHGRDRPQVTNGPPILRLHELGERRRALAHMYQPPKTPGVPTKGVLRRPLYRPCVDQRALDAMDIEKDDGDDTEVAESDGGPEVGIIDAEDTTNVENPGVPEQVAPGESRVDIGKRKRSDDEPSVDDGEPPAKYARIDSDGNDVRDNMAPSQQMVGRLPDPSPRPRPQNPLSAFVIDDPTRTPEETRRLIANIDDHISRSHERMLMVQDVRDRLSAQAGGTPRITVYDVLTSLLFFH